LFTGGAAGSSAVVFSHWLALVITVPLALFSAITVLRQHGIFSVVTVFAIFGAVLICLNPVYNLMLDQKVIAEVNMVTFAVNVLTWVFDFVYFLCIILLKRNKRWVLWSVL
jgi:drug/metabolite transporter superfamily protein YnfA